MIRLRRASAIAALCVLAWAATAYAECSWVFWVWEGSTGPPPHENSTRAVSAWNTREACEQALTKKLGSDSDVFALDANTEVMVDQRAGQPRLLARRKGHPELLAVYTYVCLPDTVDPRGPKRK